MTPEIKLLGIGNKKGRTRRQAVALVFYGLVMELGVDQAFARMHGGMASGAAPGSFVSLTTTTVVEQSGSTQHNVPFEVWVPFSPTAFAATSTIGALDADGTTQLAVQEDNRITDLNSAVRGLKISGILPTLNANEKRQITTGYYPTTSPMSGTDISTADILATAYDCTMSCANNDGNTYTCSVLTGLAASTWTNTTTAANYGTWRQGGGIVTEYIVYVPLKNGSTPHPGQLFGVFCVSAYKLNRGAVSGGNPITMIKTQYWLENAFAQQSSPIDCFYDLTVSSGSNTASWIGSSPALTLTLSGNVPGGFAVTVSTATGTPFSANSVGMAISDGTGYGVICGYTDAKHVSMILFKAFSGTSIGSGSWRIYGLNHPNGSTWNSDNGGVQTLWYSGLQQPNLTTYLGAAYNSGTLIGGPSTYIFQTAKVTRNYNTAASAVTNDVSELNLMGTNPTAYVSGSYQHGNAGDIIMDMGRTGGRTEIGDVPGIYVGGLIKWDADGQRIIYENASKAALCAIKYRDATTGLTTRMDTGTDYYVLVGSSSGTQIQTPTDSINNWQLDTNHYGHFFYIPYILTGDFFWAEMLQAQASWTWYVNSTGYAGSQLDRMAAFKSGNECRGVAWTLQKIAEAASITPDRSPACLGWPQSHARTWLSNHMTTTNSGIYATPPYPGAVISYINNVGGSGKVFATSGPRWVGENGGSGNVISMWMLGYLGHSLFKIKKMGMADSNMLNLITFVQEGLIYNATATTEIVPTFMVSSYWMDQIYNSTSFKNGADIYQATAIDPIYAGNNRTINSAVTLSAISGTITFSLPAGTVLNGGSAFYVDGAVIELGPGATGIGRITGISGDTVTMTTSGSLPPHDNQTINCAPFSTVSLSANGYQLPWPAVGDALGTTWDPAPYSQYYEYLDLGQTNAVQSSAQGYANGAAALSAINAMYTGGNDVKWKCAA